MSNWLVSNTGTETLNVEDFVFGSEESIFGGFSTLTRVSWQAKMCSEVDEDDLSLTNYLLKRNDVDDEEAWESGEELRIGGDSFGDTGGGLFELAWSLHPEDLDTSTYEVSKLSYEEDKRREASEVELVKEDPSKKKQLSKKKVVADCDITLESDESDVCEVKSMKTPSRTPRAVKNVRNNSSKVEQSPAKTQAEKAKAQRAKKKKYVEELQDTITQLNTDKAGLQQVTMQLTEKIENLREEVSYLKGVIANQSELAAILRTVSNTPGIEISCSALQDNECSGKVNKRKSDLSSETESNVDGKNSKKRKTNGEVNGKAGVCVHVQSGKVSVEFCAECSKKANGILSKAKGSFKENSSGAI